jgi:hypothetical protein
MEAAAVNLAPTADAWRERITAQRTSGQSIRAWCRNNRLAEHAFYWWRRRLGLSPATARKRRSKQTKRLGFAEVVVDRAAVRPGASLAEPPAASLVEPILLRFAGRRELVLPVSMPVGQIAGLIRELEGAQ